ncbi:MAG: CPBP family intramembrane metalloprotease [bacterium]|nr:MAG: CPBP family intramembrane metalloprotease [bacterium]
MVFLPLFLGALLLYRLEQHSFRISMVLDRFRLKKPGKKVLGISIAGTIAISLLTYIFIEIEKFVDPNFTAQPAFMSLQPLGKGDYWILLAWLPMFFFNIVGEALFWRGYIFPRQEAHFGNTTWMVHGLLWTFFHLPFGWNLMFTLLPILFLTSYLVQITRSTWTDIVIHTIINGTGFLLIAFGIVA